MRRIFNALFCYTKSQIKYSICICEDVVCCAHVVFAGLALAALRHRAAHLTVKGATLLQQKCGGGQLKFEGQPWNSCTVAQIALAKAHTEMVLLQV